MEVPAITKVLRNAPNKEEPDEAHFSYWMDTINVKVDVQEIPAA